MLGPAAQKPTLGYCNSIPAVGKPGTVFEAQKSRILLAPQKASLA